MIFTKKSVKMLRWIFSIILLLQFSVIYSQDYSLSFDGVDDYVDLSVISSSVQGNNVGSISLDFKASPNATSFNFPIPPKSVPKLEKTL